MPKTKARIIKAEILDDDGCRWSISYDPTNLLKSIADRFATDKFSQEIEKFLSENLERRMKALVLDLRWDALQELEALRAFAIGIDFIPKPKEEAITKSPYLKELQRTRRRRSAGRPTAKYDETQKAKFIASVNDIVSAWERPARSRRTMPPGSFVAKKLYPHEASPAKHFSRELDGFFLSYPANFDKHKTGQK